MASFFDEIEKNKLMSYLLLALFFLISFGFFFVFSFVFLGVRSWLGLLLSFLLASGYISASYMLADKALLKIAGARPARKDEFPYLVNVVEGLSIAAGIPAPKIYVIDDAGLNAFATGMSPQKASVAFTTGLLKAMNRQELEGVAAHEISHIRNYDSRIATLVVVTIGLVCLLSDVGLRSLFQSRGRSRGGGLLLLIGLIIVILAPIAAQLVRLALSRQREYLSDATAVQLTRYPPGLASALEKIKKMGSVVEKASDATASLYFANPLSGGLSFFSTHPPIEERIRRLRMM
ncbi:MAG: M48 family metallopeptidase [Candidatus Micrarchaeota archaeon]|nr:M48 family metallopeptidase [Candidatus Micrarchaeota archaeon]